MRILVTGSNGFLATPAVELLRRRHARLSLLTHRHAGGAASCELADAEQTSTLLRRIRPTHVIHLAGRAGRASWQEYWAANVDATHGLLEAVAGLPEASRLRIIIAGSAGEYGAPQHSGPIVENDPLEPVTPYGTVKRAQYLLASSYRHRGLQVIWARIFNVVGPGMSERLALGAFAAQIANVERGLADRIQVGSLAAKRDYVDARDVASALVTLALKGEPGEVYNVCSGRSWAMGELLRRMISSAERPVRVERDASRITRGEVRNVYGSYRKLAALGWRPRIGIDQSLKDTLQWHRERA